MAKWLVVVMLLAPGLVMAQTVKTVTTAQEFAAVMQDSGHRREVLGAALSTPVWAQLACRGAKYGLVPEVLVFQPVKFDSTGAPVSGAWREGIVAAGCGQKLLLNVLTEVTAPSTLATGALLPGGTITVPQVQNLAEAYAVRAAGGLPLSCKNGFVANTVFDGFDDKTARPSVNGEVVAPWKETWTLNMCGTVKTVTLHFMPGVAGISIGAVAG